MFSICVRLSVFVKKIEKVYSVPSDVLVAIKCPVYFPSEFLICSSANDTPETDLNI